MNKSAIILGSGRGVRRLDARESTPEPLLKTEQGEVILDKQIDSLQNAGYNKIRCLTGYHVEKLIDTHTEIDYYYDASWREQGGIVGLAHHLELLDGEVLLMNGTTLFETGAVELLTGIDADVVVGMKRFSSVDTAREAERALNKDLVVLDNGSIKPASRENTVPDARLTGLVNLSQRGTEAIRSEINSAYDGDEQATPTLVGLLHSLSSRDITVRTVDVGETAQQYDEENALAKYLLSTKADTLERIEGHIESARFPEQVAVDVDTYERSPGKIVERVQSIFSKGPIVVRSSAASEDGWHDSQAGAFHTELNISPSNKQNLIGSIERVVEGLKASSSFSAKRDQILIQKQIENVAMSGVVFTRKLDSRGPYTVINYDENSGRTDTVTAGQGTPQRAAYFHHSIDGTGNIRNEKLASVKHAIDEIRTLLDDPPLDIEFALGEDGLVNILQVRPLAVHTGEHRYDERDITEEIETVMTRIEKLQSQRPFLLGEGTVLGVMPDWNPAEMIGSEPNPLAVSLYEYLITDDVWAQARAESGYRNVGSTPLMISLAGRPYIDSLAVFNSFLPASLPEELGRRLVEHYVQRLSDNPCLQDKVEFDIAFTCLDFGFADRKRQLKDAGFNENDIEMLRTHLRSLTNEIVQGDVASISEQRDRLVRLEQQRRRIVKSPSSSWPQTVRRVEQLLADSREFGTLPFAILARYAFIATAFLQSLSDQGAFTDEEYETVLEGIPTIAGELAADSQRLRKGDLSPSTFFERYGHLRPGTYDICSPRYDEQPEKYFDIESAPDFDPIALDRKRDSVVDNWTPSVSDEAEEILARKRDNIATFLEQEGFKFSVDDIYQFITQAIPLRELAKFAFTRNVSVALTLLRNSAEEELGMESHQIAAISLDRLLESATKNPSPVLNREFERLVNYREKRKSVQQRVELPPLIRGPEDVRSFEMSSDLPNFITNKKTTAPVVRVEEHEDFDREDLDGHIVLVAAADPGYDWIFGYDIAGLVTKYGGVASHMSIRAAEFGLPAAIGCGEVIFDRLKEADVIELDCAAGNVQEVS